MQVKVRFFHFTVWCSRRSEVRNICRKSCANALIPCVCGYCSLSSNRFALEFLQYLLPPKTSEKLSLTQNGISSSLFIACFTISVNTRKGMSNTGVEYSLSLKDLFTSKIRTATTATERLNSTVGKVQSSFSSIGSALGIGFGVAGAISFGKSVLDSLTNYEYFSSSLRTLMHGDERAAKALQDQLVNLASKTPFSLT